MVAVMVWLWRQEGGYNYLVRTLLGWNGLSALRVALKGVVGGKEEEREGKRGRENEKQKRGMGRN